MAMSRKDYQAFADMFNDQLESAKMYRPPNGPAYVAALKDAIDGAATIFKADNNRFDRDRFMKACGCE
jgi:hypothetical protein